MLRWLLVTTIAPGCTAGTDEPPADPNGLIDAVYAVAVRLQGDGGSLVALVDDPARPEPLDLTGGLPLPGGGAVAGSPFDPSALFVLSHETGVMSRFRVGADGRFSLEAEMGVPELQTSLRFFGGDSFTFLAPDLAYLFDPVAGELRAWDPQAMELRGRIVLSRDLVPGPLLFPVVGHENRVVGDELFTTIAFANSIEDVADATSLVSVTDTVRGELVELVAVDTCGYVRHSWVGADGTIRYGTDAFSTAVGIASGGDRAGPSCVMGFDPATRTQLAEPVLAAADLFDGAPAGNFVFVSDDQLWARVLDETTLPPDLLTTVELTAGPYWRWGFVDGLQDPVSTVLSDWPVGTSFADPFDIGGVRYAVENTPDFMGSRLLRLETDGRLTAGIETDQSIVELIPLGAAVPEAP